MQSINSLWWMTKKQQRWKTEQNLLFSGSSVAFANRAAFKAGDELPSFLARCRHLEFVISLFVCFCLPPPSLACARYKQRCESAGRVAGRAAADILTVGRDLWGGCRAIWRPPRSSSARAELIISLTRNWTVTWVRGTFQRPQLVHKTFQSAGLLLWQHADF